MKPSILKYRITHLYTRTYQVYYSIWRPHEGFSIYLLARKQHPGLILIPSHICMSTCLKLLDSGFACACGLYEWNKRYEYTIVLSRLPKNHKRRVFRIQRESGFGVKRLLPTITLHKNHCTKRRICAHTPGTAWPHHRTSSAFCVFANTWQIAQAYVPGAYFLLYVDIKHATCMNVLLAFAW